MNQKGFTALLIILGVVILIAIIAGAFYLRKTIENSISSPRPPLPQTIITDEAMTRFSRTVNPTPNIADEIASWKTYTNKDINLTFKYPTGWNLKELSDKNAKDGVDITGPEGIVHTAWGKGFGGGCDLSEQENFQIFGEVQKICHGVDNQGVESWNQIYKKLSPQITFSLFAQANSPYQKNRGTILTILSTFKFTN